MSVVDVDPFYEELGGWWLVPQVNLVVRGRLSGVIDTFTLGDAERDVWQLDVIEILLGEGGSTVSIARNSSAEIAAGVDEYQMPWAPGDEGIFFLVPAFGSDALPELHAALMGSIGTVTDSLDHWSLQIPRASEALATSTMRSATDPTEVVLAVQTEVIAEGVVDDVGPAEEVLGWEYLRIRLRGAAEVWSPGPEPSPEEGVPPPLPSELDLIVPADGERTPAEGEKVRVMLRRVSLPEPTGSTWLAVGGDSGFLDTNVPIAELVSEMDENRGKRDEFILGAREKALAILRPIAAEAGRIPLVSDPPPVVEPRDPSELYRSPLTIETDEALIVFDRWFFALLDGMATVTVTSSDGEVLAEGPVEGPDAIMRELPDGSFEFVNESGEVVAVMTQAELSEGATTAYQEYQSVHEP